MQGRLRRIAALLVCLIFGALELSASAPGLHRHTGSLDGTLRSAQTSTACPRSTHLDGRTEQTSRDCPACTISGLFAIASPGVPAWAPAAQVQSSPPDAIRALPTPFVAGVRGRAPPSA